MSERYRHRYTAVMPPSAHKRGRPPCERVRKRQARTDLIDGLERYIRARSFISLPAGAEATHEGAISLWIVWAARRRDRARDRPGRLRMADQHALGAPVTGQPLTLRPYQQEAVDAVQAAARRGVRRPLVVLPTGGGKTLVASGLIAQRGGSALLIAFVPRQGCAGFCAYRGRGEDPAGGPGARARGRVRRRGARRRRCAGRDRKRANARPQRTARAAPTPLRHSHPRRGASRLRAFIQDRSRPR